MKTLKQIRADFEERCFPNDTFNHGSASGRHIMLRTVEKAISEIREHVLSQQRQKVGNKPIISDFNNQAEFQSALRLWEIEFYKLKGMIEAFDAIEGRDEAK